MTHALSLLESLRRAGVSAALEDGRLRLRGRQAPPAELVDRLRAASRDVVALLAAAAKRVPAFEHQAQRPGAVPVLALPGVVPTAGACFSCGSPVAEGWRCPACILAAWQVLELASTGREPQHAE